MKSTPSTPIMEKELIIPNAPKQLLYSVPPNSPKTPIMQKRELKTPNAPKRKKIKYDILD